MEDYPSDLDDSLNHYILTDLAAVIAHCIDTDLATITEDVEFEGYESPLEPDASEYEKALYDIAHKAAVASNYDPHAIDKAIYDAEREVWRSDRVIRGLIGTVENGIQPEPHTLVAPSSLRARLK